MLFLVFHIGRDLYALEARQVEVVLPRVALKLVPQAAGGVAGVFNYHGAPVPVVDVSALVTGQPVRSILSSRIVVVCYPTQDGSSKPLGLLVERATETIRKKPEDFQSAGVSVPSAPYLGPVTTDQRGLIQWVDLDKLLSPEIRAQLWRQAEVSP